MISIGIIEDIKDLREPLFEFISSRDEFLCNIAVESVEKFLEELSKNDVPIDVILLDIGLPGISGLNAIKLIKDKLPDVSIIMLTVFDDSDRIFAAIQAGALGYLVKNTPLDKIKQSIVDTYNGGTSLSPEVARKVLEFFDKPKNNIESPLTEKEKQIVACMVDGQSFKMIAANLGNTLDTIKSHAKNIYKKLHVNSKAEVIAKSFRGEI